MKVGASISIEKNKIEYGLYHSDSGTLVFDMRHWRDGGDDAYLCNSIHIKDMETASYIFTTLARACGCDVTNPYEEASYYADSELGNESE
jgi:hypothetical protein